MVFSAAAVVASVATVSNVISANKARSRAAKQQQQALDLQRQANADARANQKAALAQSQQAQAQANKKSPNVAGMAGSLGARQGAGASGTMLTGQYGVNPNDLNLGGNTLLGG
tara:strand:+ start:1338 stop:1676 length:339 start_codon:yes stop_codon:yes gene_type:complete